jgi:hypothetical protein
MCAQAGFDRSGPHCFGSNNKIGSAGGSHDQHDDRSAKVIELMMRRRGFLGLVKGYKPDQLGKPEFEEVRLES